MLENIEHLEAPVLQRLLRRTVLMTLVTGGIAIVISLLVAPPFAAVGIALGLGVAILNLRFLDAGVAKVEGTGEGSGKVIKRMLRTKTATRLAVITVIAIGVFCRLPSRRSAVTTTSESSVVDAVAAAAASAAAAAAAGLVIAMARQPQAAVESRNFIHITPLLAGCGFKGIVVGRTRRYRLGAANMAAVPPHS